MSTRDDAIQRTSRKIHDIGSGTLGATDVILSDTEIGEEVDAAVIQYSQDRPREYVKDLTTQTDPYIAVSDLTGWIDGFSRLLSLEPQAAAVGTTYTPSYLLNLDDGVVTYRDGIATYLRLVNITPVTADILRFRYTVPHTLSASVDTIPTVHFDAVCDLAAAFCCTRLAAKFSASSDSTIAADSVNYRDGQLRMKQTGEVFRAQYARKIGAPADGGVAGASITGDWDVNDSMGQDRIFHRRVWR